MHIESIHAQAFGPFKDQRLEFSKGMTVIHGPNESGKSSWHAALYVGLCGIRRGAGLRAEDREFRERHRPWAGESWQAAAVVKLADGRRVRLHHDLEGKIDCYALDEDLGRDYSSEIMSDGVPDGSGWLGLDRRTFLTTACIRQADIQSVREQADSLQKHLERAAATAGADATAAAAIQSIERFRRENVGLNRRNTTRPLRAAHNRLTEAWKRLEDAQTQHREYLRLQGQTETDQDSLAAAELALRAADAAKARLLADLKRQDANRAKELVTLDPAEPVAPSELRQQVLDVRTAVGVFENQPNAVSVGPPTSEEILRQIKSLPPTPEGDRRPHPDVANAEASRRAAQSALEQHRGRKPPEPEDVHTGNLTPQEIRRLADRLGLEEPAVDPSLEERIGRAQTRLDALQPENHQRSEKPVPPFLLPFVLIVRFLALLLRPLIGGRNNGVDYEAVAKATEELRQAEAAFGGQRFRIDSVRESKAAARTTANEAELTTNPTQLLELAASAERQDAARQDLTRWGVEESRLRQSGEGAAETLRVALESRDAAPVDDNLPEAVEDYVRECEQRDTQARLAEGRPGMERELDNKRAQEESAADAGQKRADAARALEASADAVGVSANAVEGLAAQLRLWLEDAGQSIQEREEAWEHWRELQDLLDGHTPAELEEQADHIEQEAVRLSVESDGDSIRQAQLAENLDELMEQRRSAADAARTRLANTTGQFEQFSAGMPSVAEAEEELDKAKAEFARVDALDQTLDRTLKLLQSAQDRVHRDLAPKLRKSLRPWLRTVTNGRYQDLRVDPETLKVTVSGNGTPWRDATLLSHGTAEQIYLLLRVVMTRYLTKPGETCPLLLDDITVHCDPERQTAILSLLHQISAEQQVILFSQEPETLEWALANLSGPDDNLIHLNPKIVQA